ncbi:MAG TPA: hypothetical protein VEU96_17385 [Bryobacteraceae bacterium]|nr:hypothetical protein [Bryobacteraceae bacterium]
MQRPLNVIFLVVLSAAFQSACHKKQAGIPVPSAPVPTTTAPDSATPPAATPPAPTTSQPTPPAPTTTQPPPPTPTPPPEEQPKPPVRRPPQRTTPANPATPPNSPPAPNQPPRLGTLLTPEQQRQFSNDIDRSLRRAQASLHSIGNRQLTADQHERVVQVESFIQQAQAARKSNLAGAKSLAERAEVLARDLVASLR